MKNVLKISALTLAVASGNALAITSTGGGYDADGTTLSFPADGTTYVQTAFNYQMSSNVAGQAIDDIIVFSVGTAHIQGRFSFGGDSDGGTVGACEAAASTTGYATAVTAAVGDGCAGRS